MPILPQLRPALTLAQRITTTTTAATTARGLPFPPTSPHFLARTAILSPSRSIGSTPARRSGHHYVPPRGSINYDARSSAPAKSPLKFWPFLAITLAGSGAYYLLVQDRLAQASTPPSSSASQRSQKRSPSATTTGPFQEVPKQQREK